MDERTLIGRVIAGAPGAGEEFVDRYSALVWSVLHGMGIPACHAEDIFQEVFVHLLESGCRRLSLWRGDGKFSSFLALLVRRRALDRIRDIRRRETLSIDGSEEEEAIDPPTPEPGPEDLALLAEQRAAIRAVLEQLSPRDAKLIRRKHWHGQTYKEMAQELGMTVNNVGVALSRAEKRLQDLLRKQYPGMFENI